VRKAWTLAVLGLGLVALFALLTVNVVAGRTAALDMEVMEAARSHAAQHHWCLVGLRWATHLGDWVFLGPAGVVVLAALLWRRRFALAVLYVVVALGGHQFNRSLKQVYDRPRPPVAERDTDAVQLADASYPSGHTMAAMINFGLLGYVYVRWGRGRRSLVAALLCAAVLLVALSRVYLRAHWLTDVLGGMTAGAAWLALWVAMAEALRHRRRVGGRRNIFRFSANHFQGSNVSSPVGHESGWQRKPEQGNSDFEKNCEPK
jgi:undecaprenyl-diphosphatase